MRTVKETPLAVDGFTVKRKIALGVLVASLTVPAFAQAVGTPVLWWSASKAEDHLATGYRAVDPSEIEQLQQNLGFATAALANAQTPDEQIDARGSAAQAKSDLARAKRGYPVDFAICSGRGASKTVAYEDSYRVFRCRMSVTSDLGYVRLWGTLRVLGRDKYAVTNILFSADN